MEESIFETDQDELSFIEALSAYLPLVRFEDLHDLKVFN